MEKRELEKQLRELADADKNGDSGGVLPAALLELLRGDAESQARAEQIIEKMAANHAETDARISKLEESQSADAKVRTEEIVKEMAKNRAETDARIAKLEESQSADAQTRAEEIIQKMAATHAETETRIAALESAQNNGFNALNKKTVWNICLTSAVILLGVAGVVFWAIR